MPVLQVVDLAYNSLTGAQLADLHSSAALLHLACKYLPACAIAALCSLKMIGRHYFGIAECGSLLIPGLLPWTWSNLSSLQFLDVGANNLAGAGIYLLLLLMHTSDLPCPACSALVGHWSWLPALH